MSPRKNAAGLLDAEALCKGMLEAMRTALGKRGRGTHAIVEIELRRLAAVLADVGGLLARGQITRVRAEKLVAIYQNTMRGVLRDVEGLTLLAANDALRAAIGIAGTFVNRAVGFPLLPNTPDFKAGKDL
jgi:hypothetical protein